VAEALFSADSSAVAEILRLRREGGIPHDMTTVAVLSIDDLLDGVGLDTDRRLGLYRDSVSLSRQDGQDYRSRRGELRELLGQPGALAGLLQPRRRALTGIAASLESLERDGRLTRTRLQLCRSYLHMHANRLGVADQEQRALQLLRRTREGLSRAPAV
jgi:thiopeptide-type bacteriocin biosynthesis protein